MSRRGRPSGPLIRHGVAEKTARAVMADYDWSASGGTSRNTRSARRAARRNGIGWLVEGIKADYRPQASIFELEAEAKRKAAQEERTRKAALDAEVELIKQACDEHNHKAGIALLDSLDAEELETLDSEFLARYGDVPLLGKRFKQEGRKSPLVLALYLIFLREKHPEASMNYLQLAYPLLEPANLGVADHRFIRPHSCRASLRHQASPSIEEVRRHAMPPWTDSPGS